MVFLRIMMLFQYYLCCLTNNVFGVVSAGFKVAVISRDSSRLDKLRSFVSPKTNDNLTTIVGNVGESGSRWSSAASIFKPHLQIPTV